MFDVATIAFRREEVQAPRLQQSIKGRSNQVGQLALLQDGADIEEAVNVNTGQTSREE